MLSLRTQCIVHTIWWQMYLCPMSAHLIISSVSLHVQCALHLILWWINMLMHFSGVTVNSTAEFGQKDNRPLLFARSLMISHNENYSSKRRKRERKIEHWKVHNDAKLKVSFQLMMNCVQLFQFWLPVHSKGKRLILLSLSFFFIYRQLNFDMCDKYQHRWLVFCGPSFESLNSVDSIFLIRELCVFFCMNDPLNASGDDFVDWIHIKCTKVYYNDGTCAVCR